MGVLVGLLLGAGAFCVWWSFWPRQQRPAQRAAWRSRVDDHLQQAGLGSVPLRALVASCLACGAMAGVVVLAVSQSPPIALAFASMASWAPVGLVNARARRRRAQLRDLWPEAVDHLASGIRAGLSLPESLGQLGNRGPVELRPPFTAFAEDYRATGRFADSLERLKVRLADPVADRIVEALRLTREVGGSDLGRLLRTLSAFLREDARTRAELEARQSWTVNAAKLAVAAPWVVLAMLATRPEAVSAYNRPAGVLVLAVGGALSLVAYRLMVRIGRLPEEERVLR
jgi:tight adherence protein B